MENGWFGLSLVFILIDFQSFFQDNSDLSPLSMAIYTMHCFRLAKYKSHLTLTEGLLSLVNDRFGN